MMNKANFIYIAFFISIILMFYVLHNIWNKSNYEKGKKWVYTYVTVLFPIIGFLIILFDRKELKT